MAGIGKFFEIIPMIKTKQFVHLENLSNGEAIQSPSRFEACFIVGTAVRSRDFSLEFRYEKPNGLLVDLFRYRTMQFQFLVGFKFNRQQCVII